MRKALHSKRLASQVLLIPEIVDIPEEDCDRLMVHAAEFSELGLAIERFGPGAIAVRETPAMLGEVDAVIVGDRHGGLHRVHAIAALEAGRPVFVDKPLANSLGDATAIVDAAERHGVPVLSGSALRWQAETRRLKAKLAGLDGPMELLAYGTWYPQNEYGGAIFYAIHTVELVQELLGIGWRKLKLKAAANPVIQFKTNRTAVSLDFRPLGPSGSSAFGVEVKGKGIEFQQPIALGDDYMAPVATKFAKMIATGKPCLSHQDLLAPIRLMGEIDALLG